MQDMLSDYICRSLDTVIIDRRQAKCLVSVLTKGQIQMPTVVASGYELIRFAPKKPVLQGGE